VRPYIGTFLVLNGFKIVSGIVTELILALIAFGRYFSFFSAYGLLIVFSLASWIAFTTASPSAAGHFAGEPRKAPVHELGFLRFWKQEKLSLRSWTGTAVSKVSSIMGLTFNRQGNSSSDHIKVVSR